MDFAILKIYLWVGDDWFFKGRYLEKDLVGWVF